MPTNTSKYAGHTQGLDLRIGDCLEVMRSMPDASVDLVFCSPPYEEARTYGIDFDISGQAWVDWVIQRYIECLRISRGLVAWVVEGTGQQTVEWSATPALLMADLHRQGIPIWKPALYGRYSVPGRFSVLRNNYEWVICSSGGKPLPWSDPTACGEAPKCAPGGRTRPRKQDGSRNIAGTEYKQPTRTNYGNLIWCGAVGGGNMGHELATENEAPYPLFLAEVFVRSFCPPDGTVYDPFCGSGTTGHAALRHGRRFIGSDIRESQIDLTTRRLTSLEQSQ